jgi:hypothetical protein
VLYRPAAKPSERVDTGNARPSDRLCRTVVLVSVVMTFLTCGPVAPREHPWRSIFNGQDLDGWEHVGPGRFVLENGMLRTEGGMGLLWYTRETFGHIAIRVVYRNPGGVNSGVFIRIPERLTEPWLAVHRGYEVQIDDRADDHHRTGVLYSFTRAAAKPVRADDDDDWNTMEIALDGDRTMVHVNGAMVTDYREGQAVPPKKEPWEPDRGPRPTAGYIGLQNHGSEDVVFFREVSVRPLQ